MDFDLGSGRWLACGLEEGEGGGSFQFLVISFQLGGEFWEGERKFYRGGRGGRGEEGRRGIGVWVGSGVLIGGGEGIGEDICGGERVGKGSGIRRDAWATGRRGGISGYVFSCFEEFVYEFFGAVVGWIYGVVSWRV